jgi:putative phosphoribosyl transferase
VAYQSEHGFQDRAEAGRSLAQRLENYAFRDDVVVLGLPRGGVPVAFEIAHALRAPLDIVVVLKLCIARYPELALGAVAAGDAHVLNEELVRRLGISQMAMANAIAAKRAEIAGRNRALRDDRAPIDVTGATVILVDDGLATGASMRVAIVAVREQGPALVVVAVPVASREAAESIGQLVDEIVTVICPASFVSVGNWYRCFAQVSDGDVRSLLSRSPRPLERKNGGEPE